MIPNNVILKKGTKLISDKHFGSLGSIFIIYKVSKVNIQIKKIPYDEIIRTNQAVVRYNFSIVDEFGLPTQLIK